jgi:hypothetical protein
MHDRSSPPRFLYPLWPAETFAALAAACNDNFPKRAVEAQGDDDLDDFPAGLLTLY